MQCSYLVALVIAAFGTAKKAKDIKSEMDRLQGDWICVSAEVRGKPIPPAKLTDSRLKIDGKVWTRKLTGDPSTYHATLDPFKTPKQIDLDFQVTRDTPGSAPGVTPGIYKIEGDTLSMCLGFASRRPTEFETTKVGVVWCVWKRREKR